MIEAIVSTEDKARTYLIHYIQQPVMIRDENGLLTGDYKMVDGSETTVEMRHFITSVEMLQRSGTEQAVVYRLSADEIVDLYGEIQAIRSHTPPPCDISNL